MSKLHLRLAGDTLELGFLPLCRVLLMNDCQYPWLVLVPERDDMVEIYQLSDADQIQLIHESSLVSRVLMELFKGDKMNIGALGNIVPQLHIHHIVRYQNDPAWPGPVWGAHEPRPYTEALAKERLESLRVALSKVMPLRVEHEGDQA